MFKTTTDILEASKDVLAQAEKVTTREEHVSVWDRKVDVLRALNSAIETGYFTGEAYSELRQAQTNLYKAEDVAGLKALATYLKDAF